MRRFAVAAGLLLVACATDPSYYYWDCTVAPNGRQLCRAAGAPLMPPPALFERPILWTLGLAEWLGYTQGAAELAAATIGIDKGSGYCEGFVACYEPGVNFIVFSGDTIESYSDQGIQSLVVSESWHAVLAGQFGDGDYTHHDWTWTWLASQPQPWRSP